MSAANYVLSLYLAGMASGVIPYQVRKYLEAPEYTCKNCGCTFKTTSHNKISFCSGECYRSLNNKRKELK